MGHLEGDLSVMPVSDVVVWLANRQMTGHLVLEQETVRKELAIENGMAKRAASNDAREYFGQFLMHLGLLTEDQLERAYATQRETRVLLGRILVMIGIVPEEQVIQTLRIKIAENLLDAFRWRWGRFRFSDAASHESRPAVDVSVPLIQIHREGMARSEMWARFRELFPNPSQPLRVAEEHLPSHMTPDTLEARIIDLARNGLDMESITLELHATDYQVASRLLELSRVGAIYPSEGARADSPLPRSTSHDPISDARAAMDRGHFGDAMRHLQDGARLDPGNRAYAEMRQDIEAAASQTDLTNLRTAVPMKLREASADELTAMSSRERYVLGRVDGKRTVQAIIHVSPMHDLEALDILRRLASTSVIKMEGL
ncbi:MAG: DUF4388 domain-containing protein [Myxococcota bacterium]